MTDLERYAPGGALTTQAEERRWEYLWRMAGVFSQTALVPKGLQGDQPACMAGLLLCDALHVDPRTAIGQLHLIEGKLEPSSQMIVGIADANGYDTRWGRQTDEIAELFICRSGDDEWETFTYTIEQARTAGRLDQWVERWNSTGETWGDSGKPKKSLERFVLNRPEVTDIPEWVRREVAAGRTKRNEQWHRYPSDMLCSKVAKRAVKRKAPHLLLGLDRVAAVAPDYVVADDDEIAEGDVSFRPPGQAAGPAPDDAGPAPSTRGPAYPPLPEDQATDTERAAILTLLEVLDDDAKAAVRAKAQGIPNVTGPRFTHDHAATLLALITAELAARTRHHGSAAVVADAPAGPSTAGAADGGGPAQAPPPAPSSDDDGRPFE